MYCHSADMLVHQIFEATALREPARSALECEGITITYRALNSSANQLAAYIQQICPTERAIIALSLEKGPLLITAVLAVLKAGMTWVPLPLDAPRARIQNILDIANPALVLATGSTQSITRDLCLTITLDHAAARELVRAQSEKNLLVHDIFPNDLCHILFTSGSTGLPKAVMIEHRAVVHNASFLAQSFQLNEDTRTLQFAAYTFDIFGLDLFMTFAVGGCLILGNTASMMLDLTDFINKAGVTYTQLTPTVMSMIKPSNVPSLCILASSGEPLTTEIVNRWRDRVRLINAYGPTETIVCTVQDLSLGDEIPPQAIGTAVDGLEVVLMRENSTDDVEFDEIGEICVAGVQLFRGYMGIDEKHSGFCYRGSQRFYRTGDIGCWQTLTGSQKTIICLGRRDNQVKVNGIRLDLGEVEKALVACVLVRHSVAFVPKTGPAKDKLTGVVSLVDDEKWKTFSIEGTNLKLCQPTQESQKSIFKDLINQATELLLPQAVPTTWWFTIELPLTSSGKIDRMSVRNCIENISMDDYTHYMQSWLAVEENGMHRYNLSETQQRLVEICARVIQLDPGLIDPQTPLLRLGFDSLSLIRLVSTARDTGLDLNIQQVLRESTIIQIAASIGNTHLSQQSIPTIVHESCDLYPSQPDFDSLKVAIAEQCHLELEDIVDIYPCTPLQAGMMALAARSSDAYICEMSYILSSSIDPTRLQFAWNQLIAETPLLRNRIVQGPSSKGLLQATVHPKTALSDSCSYTAPMSLGDGLCRSQTTWDDDLQQWRFKLKIHHSLFDGWSKHLILIELKKIYNAERRDPASASFKNFVQYLTKDNSTGETEHLSFWENQFVNCPVTDFPTLPLGWNGELQSYEVFSYKMKLDVTNMAKKHNVTPTTVLNAAWAVVLSKHASTDDVVFGITLAGRDAPVEKLEHSIGPTMVTVPCRAQIDTHLSVEQFVQQLHQYSIDIIPHKFIGLQEIVKAGAGGKNACSFRTLLVVQPDRSLQAETSDFLLEEHHFSSELLRTYPLTIELLPDQDSLEIKAYHDPTLISARELGWISRHFEVVLQELCIRDPSTLIVDINLCDENEKEQILSFSTNFAPKIDQCLHELFMNSVAESHKHIAILQQSPRVSVTYAQLELWSTSLASHLISHYGVGRGHIVPISFEKSAVAIISMLSVLKTGAAYMPLDVRQPQQRVTYMIQSVKASLVLCSSEHTSALKGIVKEAVEITDDWLSDLVNRQTPCEDLPTVSPADAAIVFFTSGSTGQPKGIVSKHSAVSTSMTYFSQMLQMQSTDRVLQFTPFTFDMGLKDIYCTLLTGGCICLPSKNNELKDLPHTMNIMNINVAFLTPTVAAMINPHDVPKLRLLNLGGERANSSVIQIWSPQTRLINSYGPTETVACLTAADQLNSDSDPDIIGYDITGHTWLVQSDSKDDLIPTPLGCRGQIAITGHTVAEGYLNDSEKTDKAFLKLPSWIPAPNGSKIYLTGDMGVYSADGRIKYAGRNDQQIKIFGIRTEPAEVEFHLHQLGGSFSSAVVEGVRDRVTPSSLNLAVFIVAQQKDQQLSSSNEYIFIDDDDVPAELRTQCRDAQNYLSTKLPKHMVPSLFIPISRLPMTSSHKINRKHIRDAFESDSLRGRRNLIGATSEVQHKMPETELERLFADAWAEALGTRQDLSLQSEFFSTGGDSFATIRLVLACRKRGINISVAQAYEHSTLEKMVAVATACSNTESPDENTRNLVPFSLIDGNLNALLQEVSEICHIPTDQIQDMYPASPFQEGLTAISLGDDAVYMAHWVFALDRGLDLNRLRDAMESVIANNPIMRTVLAHTSDTTFQVVAKYERFANEDSSEAHQPEQTIVKKTLLEGRTLFNYKFTSKVHEKPYLEISMHHIIYDEWVIDFIMTDLFHNYNHPENKRGGRLGYAHFIKYLMKRNAQDTIDFWRDDLNGSRRMSFPPLPISRLRARTNSSIRSQGPMQSHSSQRSNTVASVAAASLALLLSWYCRSGDVTFGLTLSGRDTAGLEEVAGPTISSVPCRVRMLPEQTTTDLLANVSSKMRTLQRHQHLGLQEIARLGEDGPQNACAFSVLLVVQQESEVEVDGGSKHYSLVEEETTMSLDYALVVNLVTNTSRETARLHIQYDSECMADQQASQIIRELERLMNQLPNEDCTIDKIGRTMDRELKLSTSLPNKIDQGRSRSMVNVSTGKQKHKKPSVCRLSQNPLQERIKEVWATITNIKSEYIGLDDTLNSLGADSISLIRLVSAVRKLGFSFSAGNFTKFTTLAELSLLLEQSQNKQPEDEVLSPFSLLPGYSREKLIGDVAAQCLVEPSCIVDVYPCTSLQEGMMASSFKHSGSYLMQRPFEIVGAFDINRVKGALHQVWKKHAVLRTRICLDDNAESLQVVVDDLDVQFGDHHLALSEYLEQDRKFGFEYGQRLSRMSLVRDPNGMSYLVLSQHHAMGDGWATNLLMEAIQTEYVNVGGDHQEESASVIPTFIKFVKNVESSSAAADFWRSNLDGTTTLTFPSPETVSHQASTWSSTLLDISKIPKNSLATMVEAAWGLVLSKYADSCDVYFGVVRSGRNVPIAGIDAMTGPAIVTIPRRLELQHSATVLEYLEQVQLLADRTTPFEQFGLQNIAKLNEGSKNACGFQTLLTIHPEQGGFEDQSGFILRTMEIDTMIGSYCLLIDCEPREGGFLFVSANFDETTISEGTIEWLLYHFSQALLHISTFPDMVVGNVSISGDRDREYATRLNITATDGVNGLESGYPLPAYTWIVDKTDLTRLAPIGCPGTLLLSGPALTARRLDNKNQPDTVIDAQLLNWSLSNDPLLLSTGDTVCQNLDGSMTFISRNDNQSKRHIHHSELSEVETFLEKCAGVSGAVMDLAKGTEDDKPILTAFVTLYGHENGQSQLLALKEDISRILQNVHISLLATFPRRIIPQHIVAIGMIPTTIAGKTDRTGLNRIYQSAAAEGIIAQNLQTAEARAFLSKPQEILRHLWAETLHVDPITIGVDDDFVALGGDSIAAIKLASRAKKRGCSLPAKAVFEYPRFEEMALQLFISDMGPTRDTEVVNGDKLQAWYNQISEIYGISNDQIEDVYSCTPVQTGLMAMTLRNPRAYVARELFRLASSIEINRFKQAWNLVYRKHELLRARFCQVHDLKGHAELVQVVCLGDAEWSLKRVTDPRSADDDIRKIGLGVPLSRFTLLDTPDGFYFQMVRHHSIYDGWSSKLLWDDFRHSYLHLEQPVSRPQFRSYVQYVQDQDNLASIDFWKQELEGFAAEHYPKPLSKDFMAETNSSLSLVTHWKQYERNSTTFATIARAAWVLTISAISRSPCEIHDICFGAVISGRMLSLDKVEEIAGPTMSTVPVRIRLDMEEPLNRYLMRISGQAAAMIPFEYVGLNSISKVDSAAKSACSFNNLLVIQPADAENICGVEGISEVNDGDQMLQPYGLMMECKNVPGTDELHLEASFDKKLLCEEEIRMILRLLARLITFLTETQKSDMPVRAILQNMCTDEDYDQMLSLNGPSLPASSLCLHQLVEKSVRSHPQRVAVSAHDQQLTYKELDECTSRLARQLRESYSVGPEVLVPIVFEKSSFMMIAILAILKAGGGYVPLDPSHPKSRLRYIIDEVNASLVLTSTRNRQLLSDCVDVKTLVIDLRCIQSSSAVKSWSADNVTPKNVAYIIFTSGSTGNPKGVVIEHGSASLSMQEHGRVFGHPEREGFRTLQFCSYTFDVSVAEMFSTLAFGGTLCIPTDEGRLNDLTGVITSMGVDTAFLTPTVAQFLRPEDVPSLSMLCMAGEPLTRALVQTWTSSDNLRKRRVFNGYGPTEATVECAARLLEPETVPYDIGSPFGGQLWIVDSEDHTRLLPVGCIGELVVSGAVLAREYLHDQKKTIKAFSSEVPWLKHTESRRLYRTGDLARYTGRGTIEYLGRKDTKQVKFYGLRVELGEIESAILSSDQRFINVVVEKVSRSEHEFLVAFFHTAQDIMASTTNRQHHLLSAPTTELGLLVRSTEEKLRSWLPTYMVPSIFLPIIHWPQTTSGKTDRRLLRDTAGELADTVLDEYRNSTKKPNGAGRVRKEQEYVEASGGDHSVISNGTSAKNNSRITTRVRDEHVDEAQAHPLASSREINGARENSSHGKSPAALRTLVTEFWQRTLHRDPSFTPDLDDDFFQLGGDSIAAIFLVAEFRKYGIQVSVGRLYESRTLEEMVDLLRSERTDISTDKTPAFSLLGVSENEVDSLRSSVAEKLQVSVSSIEDMYACTPLQEGMMFLSEKITGAYHGRFKFRLPDKLDFSKLHLAWSRLIEVHQILRTKIVLDGNFGSLQVVFATAAYAKAMRENETLDAIRFGYGLPLYQHYLSAEGGRIFFNLEIHHSLYDGWSLPVVIDDFRQLYQDLSYSPNSTPFKEFVSYLSTKSVKSAEESFWSRVLAGAVVSDFPELSGKPHHTIQATSYHSYKMSGIENLALDGVTMATICKVAWAFVVSKYIGSDDVCFGLVLSGREAPISGIESIRGPTFNTVPLRIKTASAMSTSELLRQVQAQIQEMMPYQFMSLTRIQKILSDRAREFGSLLLVQPSEIAETKNEDFDLGVMDSKGNQAAGFYGEPYPLLVEVSTDGKGDLMVTTQYDPEVVSKDQLDIILGNYETCIRQFSGRLPTPLSKISMLSKADQELLLRWAGKPIVPDKICVVDMINEITKSYPNHQAIEGFGQSITYAELEQCSNALAHRLLDSDKRLGSGSIVPVWMETSPIAVITLLAILKTGASYVPLDARLPISRAQYIVDDVQANLILVSNSKVESAKSLASSKLTVWEIKQDLMEGHLSIPKNLARSTDLAYVIYTSGTTGKPKGVMMEHWALAATLRDQAATYEIGLGTRMFGLANLSWDPSLLEIFVPLSHGGCLCIPTENERNEDLVGIINRLRADQISTSPAVASLIDLRATPTVTAISLGGECIREENIRNAHEAGVRLFNIYGPSEACIDAIVHRNVVPGTSVQNIGEPMSSQAWIVDVHDPGTLVPPGCIGEIVLSGTLARGYLNDTEKTAKSFLTNCWFASPVYCTGDLGRFAADGSIQFLGRKDRQVKLNGQRVELGEIENAVKNVLTENEVVVDYFSLNDRISDERKQLVVFVRGQRVQTPGTVQVIARMRSDTERFQSLQASLKTVLPGYMVPHVFVTVSRVPLSNADKVDFQILREAYRKWAEDKKEVAVVRSKNIDMPLAKPVLELRQLWASAIGCEESEILPKDNFFELGGDSLAILKLTALAANTGTYISVSDVYTSPTLGAMSDMLQRQHAPRLEYDEDPMPFSLIKDSLQDRVLSLSTDVLDILPCTTVQKSSIIQGQKRHKSYYAWFIIKINEDIEDQRLEDSFLSVTARHAVLRTTFCMVDDQLLQVIHGSPLIDFKRLDACSSPEDFSSLLHLDVPEPVSFNQILTRFRLSADAAGGHYLAMGMSHAQYDGFCFNTFTNDLYRAYHEGLICQTAAPSYSRFISCMLKSSSTPACQFFWTDLLRGSSMTMVNPRQASNVRTVLDSLQIKTMPVYQYRSGTVTFAMILKAAWAIVLSILSGSDDVVFGSLVFGRGIQAQRVDEIVGACMNVIPNRITITNKTRIAHLLENIKAQQISAAPFETTPLDVICQHASWPANTRFGSIVQHQNIDESTIGQRQNNNFESTWKFVGHAAYPGLCDDVDCWVTTEPLHNGTRLLFQHNSLAIPNAIANNIAQLLCDVIADIHHGIDKSLESLPSLQALGHVSIQVPILSEATGQNDTGSASDMDSNTDSRVSEASRSKANSLTTKLESLWASVVDPLSPSGDDKGYLNSNDEVTGSLCISDSFFDVGGDSLSATQLSVMCKDEGIELDIQDVFDYPTLQQQVDHLLSVQESGKGNPHESIVSEVGGKHIVEKGEPKLVFVPYST